MTVLPLPAKGAPVLQITPALLSFVAVDGGPSPASLPLSVSNPGTQPLHWSISTPSPTTDGLGAFVASSGTSGSWLSTKQTKGTVAPKATTRIQVNAQSSNLLPGAYTSTLVFNSDKGTVNNPQSVNVSLTVLPRCSLQVSTNALSFIAVQGQGNPATQVINLFASSSCSGTSTWTASATSSPSSWLSVNPASSQLVGAASSTATVAVNTANLAVGTYTGNMDLTMASTQNTQSVSVQLTVQSPPQPGAPVISASPLNFSFIATQGQSPQPQIMTIANPGGTTLFWNATVTPLISWYSVVPRGGTVPPGQTRQVTIKVKTVLTGGVLLGPGLHLIQISLNGFDANGNIVSGSPQAISVNFNVLVPCRLNSPTANALAFTAVQGASNPASQTKSFGASGNCAWPVGWNVSGSQPAWLSALSTSGSFTADGQSAI